MKKDLSAVRKCGETRTGLVLLLGFAANVGAFGQGGDAAAIHACVNQSSGNVKIVAAGAACNSGETPLQWNIQGPAPSSDLLARYQLVGGGPAIPVPNAPGYAVVGTLNLPAGSYIAVVSEYFTNDSTTTGIAYCLLRFEAPAGTPISPNAQVIDTLQPHDAVSQSLTAAAELPVAGSAKLLCTNNTLVGGNLAIQTFNLNAIRTGTLSVQ